MAEDEIVGEHHQLDGHEFEYSPGGSDGQGRLVYFSLWGHKKLGMTEQLKTNKKLTFKKLTSLHSVPSFVPNRWGKSEKIGTFYFGGSSEITIDDDCSHKIKRCLLLGRKAMTNLDSVSKSRDMTVLTKVCRVKATVFSVVMYGCEMWTIKKAKCHRIDTFEVWHWRRLLRFPCTARSSN